MQLKDVPVVLVGQVVVARTVQVDISDHLVQHVVRVTIQEALVMALELILDQGNAIVKVGLLEFLVQIAKLDISAHLVQHVARVIVKGAYVMVLEVDLDQVSVYAMKDIPVLIALNSYHLQAMQLLHRKALA